MNISKPKTTRKGNFSVTSFTAKLSKKEAKAWNTPRLSPRDVLAVEYEALKKRLAEGMSSYNRWRIEIWREMADRLEAVENIRSQCDLKAHQWNALPEEKKRRAKK